MRKFGIRVILIMCMLICAGAVYECGKAQIFLSGRKQDEIGTEKEESRLEDAQSQEDIQLQTGAQNTSQSQDNEIAAEGTEDVQQDSCADGNELLFFEKAQKQGIARKEAEKYWEVLLADNIFQDGVMELTGLVIGDMDGNSQIDMLVMIVDHETKPFYGSGCVWIYMNEDAPYCFDEEACSYYGNFECFAEDIDNDGNVEIVLSAQGTGNGGTGDFYKVIWKYKGHGIERMELISDLGEDYPDQGISVIINQEPEENRYSAYCSYFQETIYFDAENVSAPGESVQAVGSNVRGFCALRPVKYQGKNALQALEYLHGEGGIVHGVAVARFIILWDENGKSYVDTWWIEN